MPLTLTGGASLVKDTTLQLRVALGFYLVAREVFTEPKTAVGNEVRVRYARAIITQDVGEFQKLTAAVLTDQTIIDTLPATNPVQTTITDNMILGAIRAMWSRMAGVEM